MYMAQDIVDDVMLLVCRMSRGNGNEWFDKLFAFISIFYAIPDGWLNACRSRIAHILRRQPTLIQFSTGQTTQNFWSTSFSSLIHLRILVGRWSCQMKLLSKFSRFSLLPKLNYILMAWRIICERAKILFSQIYFDIISCTSALAVCWVQFTNPQTDRKTNTKLFPSFVADSLSAVLKFRNSLCLNQQLDIMQTHKNNPDFPFALFAHHHRKENTWNGNFEGNFSREILRLLLVMSSSNVFVLVAFSAGDIIKSQKLIIFIFLYRRKKKAKLLLLTLRKREIKLRKLFYFLSLKTSVRKIVGEIYFCLWLFFSLASFYLPMKKNFLVKHDSKTKMFNRSSTWRILMLAPRICSSRELNPCNKQVSTFLSNIWAINKIVVNNIFRRFNTHEWS